MFPVLRCFSLLKGRQPAIRAFQKQAHCVHSFGKFYEKSVEISPRFCYNLEYLYAQVQGLRIHAGRPIHEMRTSHIFDGKGGDSHAEIGHT